MSLVKSVPNVKRIEVAHVPTVGFIVVKSDDSRMQRRYVGQPTDRTNAIANAVALSARIGWPLNVNL